MYICIYIYIYQSSRALELLLLLSSVPRSLYESSQSYMDIGGRVFNGDYLLLLFTTTYSLLLVITNYYFLLRTTTYHDLLLTTNYYYVAVRVVTELHGHVRPRVQR